MSVSLLVICYICIFVLYVICHCLSNVYQMFVHIYIYTRFLLRFLNISVLLVGKSINMFKPNLNAILDH